MKFTKMQGLGNDYLYVYGEVPENAAELSAKLSDRRFGAGSDGMIFITRSGVADFGMRIFNADGSEAEMCGNGIRCVGKYLFDKGLTDRTRLTVETLAGVRTIELDVVSGKVQSVTVDMGKAEVSADIRLTVGDSQISGTPVSVGNPHFVIFTEDIGKAPLMSLGPLIEKHRAFPGGVNTEFVGVTGKGRLRMRVWERGSGVTSACGTGACAAAAAAVARGFCLPDSDIFVDLDGGTLCVSVSSDGRVTMKGPAEFVYEGETCQC